MFGFVWNCCAFHQVFVIVICMKIGSRVAQVDPWAHNFLPALPSCVLGSWARSATLSLNRAGAWTGFLSARQGFLQGKTHPQPSTVPLKHFLLLFIVFQKVVINMASITDWRWGFWGKWCSPGASHPWVEKLKPQFILCMRRPVASHYYLFKF